ncbi:hypothetical protein CBOM_07098 [Ceraceosorus bombacis]|uniref:Uncharacterized protein n=1 Tax=Ceraceosorus bombacis TaxID=401625 RepID=A0A0P1B9C7_9BASI|nr:hypothetical protein CBOM_07098 [Ceraceosorus bombacis]
MQSARLLLDRKGQSAVDLGSASIGGTKVIDPSVTVVRYNDDASRDIAITNQARTSAIV